MARFVKLDLWQNERGAFVYNFGERWINANRINSMARDDVNGWTSLDIEDFDILVWCTDHPDDIIRRIEAHHAEDK